MEQFKDLIRNSTSPEEVARYMKELDEFTMGQEQQMLNRKTAAAKSVASSSAAKSVASPKPATPDAFAAAEVPTADDSADEDNPPQKWSFEILEPEGATEALEAAHAR